MKKSRVKKLQVTVFEAPDKPAMKQPVVTSINIKQVRDGHVQVILEVDHEDENSLLDFLESRFPNLEKIATIEDEDEEPSTGTMQ